ncbi:response regulator [Parapedobacter koreensis]|uniref:histidine kinase n=1 Tax=Parapedobacter koreensis TaxID=332977 RepID=A0A1H7L4R8_9SPHI|nr:response regulator [Parapedobacter koreensis]SEK93696.1 His Kinase A (phospho-acceptor) domain-containing protein [Parapedobacter koreensis]
MKENAKKTPAVRIALLCCFVILFLFIGAVFIYQYGQYRVLEKRLTNAYEIRQTGSESLRYLFSTYGEVENLFRLYTLDFADSNYHAYLGRLHLLKGFVDSLASLPLSNNPMNNAALKVADQQKIAMEFATLKKRLDHLVLHTSDSLRLLNGSIRVKPIRPSKMDAIVNQVLIDSTKKRMADTIVRKKPGLFKRIFNAKDDTIVVANEHQQLDIERVTLLKENLSAVQQGIAQLYSSSLNQLRNTFLRLQEKERQLITTNLDLLNGLKENVETIEELDIYVLRQAEEHDFTLYKKNIERFGKQLIFALILMLVMIVALGYYQVYATSYERRLREEKDYAAKLAEEKTNVLANISHEIRTPLNSLLGIIDLFKNRTASGNIDAKLIDSAYYSINIISNNISDILSLSKLEASNKGDIALEYFAPHRSFQEVVTLHKNQAELKNLRLCTEIEIDPHLHLLSNEFRIRQIASNFLSNAIKYTQKGEIIFRASLSGTSGDSCLHIEVEDSGIGIKEQNRPHVFRKYFTASPNSGGIGLGLYIAKIMVEELGGTIGLKGKQEQGSIFFADIPFTQRKIETQGQQQTKLSDLPRNLRLLIVDDNPINILLMKQFFKGVGYTYTVNNGEDALAFLQEQLVDVVITDINMPGISGVELLEKIRNEGRYKSIRVLAISADMSTLKYAEERPTEASFDGFIEKPFTEAEIVKAILKALA